VSGILLFNIAVIRHMDGWPVKLIALGITVALVFGVLRVVKAREARRVEDGQISSS
jgi:hypothetical protein